jgi:GxxExxY protein
MRGELLEAERVHSIVAAFFTVFNYFGGGGMCEGAYTGALEYELTLRGHKVEREVSVPVHYKGTLVARQRLDMVVDDRVIVDARPPSASPQPRDHSSSAISARPFSRSACCSTSVHTQSSIGSWTPSNATVETSSSTGIRSNSRDSRPKALGFPGAGPLPESRPFPGPRPTELPRRESREQGRITPLTVGL